MRIRTDRRSYTHRLTHLALSTAAVFLATPGLYNSQADAAADPCAGTFILGTGAGASACQERTTSGSESNQPVSSKKKAAAPTQGALWNQWCTHVALPFHGVGLTVSFEPGGSLSAEEVESEGLDPNISYSYVSVECYYPGGGSSELRVVPNSELPAVVDPTVLRDQAMAEIAIPDPAVGSNPPFNEPGRFGVVGVPTWFWIDSPWEQIGPASESSGGLTVEVAASPQSVTWSPGDGSTPVVCDGPGVVWKPGMSEEATDCSHTYVSSSADLPGETYQLSAVVNWEFEWWINGVSQGVFGDNFEASSEFSYQVGEIQALETNSRS